MQCANPQCRQAAKDLFSGTLRMLEMEVAPEKRTLRPEGGFPVCAVPTRFFWLCEACSLTLKIRRWTAAGLILESRAGNGSPGRKPPARNSVEASLKRLSPGAV